MEKIKIEREAIVLDSGERNNLRACLQYCKHRLVNHPDCGIGNVVNVKFVDYMMSMLEEG